VSELRSEELSQEATQVLRVAHPQRGSGARVFKRGLQVLAFVAVLPRLAIYGLASLVLGKPRAFANASEGVGRIPGLRGLYTRQAFYRATLASCGRDVYFGWLCAFSTPEAQVGEGAYIGRRCGVGHATLGEEVMLADGVQILSGAHQHGTGGADSFREQRQEYRHVSIGAGAWLGAGAVIMADVGAAAVIGAGAVVNREIEARCVAAGVPARVVRRLEQAEQTPSL
jgi:acetyltransferase-like isoleucine patch superfamily enzyme